MNTALKRATSSRVLVLGIGDTSPEAIAGSIRGRVRSADLLCGGERHLSFFPEHRGERLTIKSPLEPVFDRIRTAHADGHNVVVLASGDPCCFGIGPLLVERLGREAVAIVPDVSSVQLLFARLGEPWQGAAILSAHGRPIDGVIGPALAARRVAILTDEINTPGRIASALRECGIENCRVAVGERLGSAHEQIFEGAIAEVMDRHFDPLCILALLRNRERVGEVRIGLPDDRYVHRDGMITKAEIRAVSVSKLGVKDGDVVWDIGAGCGSVGLEAASFVGSGMVYAIERDPSQVVALKENLERFPSPLRIVQAEAPASLADLPDPRAIFLGGSGGRLGDILSAAIARLRSGGRLVANFALLEHLVESRSRLADAGWESEVTQIASSRGVMTAGALRLEALNPIFVLTTTRPEADNQ